MHLNSEEKKAIFEKYGKSNTDTGSAESQIALFSIRIAHLTQHLKSNHKDHSTTRALKMLVGKRRRRFHYAESGAAFAVGEGVGSLPDNGGMPGHNHLADALARGAVNSRILSIFAVNIQLLRKLL